MTEQVLIKDLIDIPERVHRGDFVLKLADGLDHAQATVRDYVVTPQLRRCFDDALAFIQSAVEGNTSRACYLHGSFGSGKSHFMAVLNLLLAGNRDARSIPELSSVVDHHNGWTAGRRFLMVPYHMIGAHDMESAILGHYAEHVRLAHPEAPVPPFYRAEALFEDAERLRRQMGDAAYFAQLNQRREDGGAWGALEGGWDATAFETAMLEPPSGAERRLLVSALIERFFPSYRRVTAGHGEAFVQLDEGLQIMSQHAKELGYDAVILFLDELILWLATRAGDVNFVSTEGAKLSKLVEAQAANRPIPLVSFVARQRDLRDLVGENLAGSLQLQFADVLKYWEARFHRITLEDRNLPMIAQRRLLRPKSETARQTLDTAFEALVGRRQDVIETLLGREGERRMFRDVYPFSPALVQTLVAVSSLLQRERTALKLMLQLLVDRRGELAVGDIIPVGDLWDVIVEGDEPFTDAMRIQFENAKKLWSQKLLPLLERQHGVRWQDLEAGTADPQTAASLRNDARLLKTLLLGALVPEEESLRALTPDRLAALNHGSVRSPIPGRESSMVLSKLRNWAAEIGEIKLGEESTNPVVTIQITGVDTAPILANARQFDNEGNRRRKIREMLFGALRITAGDELFVQHTVTWRNTRRVVDIVHDSLFDLTDDRFAGRAGTWSVVIGLPFDGQGRPAADGRARVHDFNATRSAETIVWIPSMLSERALRDLGTLVVIDHLMVGERFDEAARHLSVVDREQARALLRNQRSQLEQRLRTCLEYAYGIASEPKDAVDDPLPAAEHLHSLHGTFTPRPPAAANLGDALEALVYQLFDHLYPAHPHFEQEIKTPTLRRVLELYREALSAPDQRLHVPDRGMRQLLLGIATPLRLATMGQTHLVPEHHWPSHFERLAHQSEGPLTVGKLRAWTDQPSPMGLPREVQNLLILCFAEQTDRSFHRQGVPTTPTLDRLDDDLELREQVLPVREDWDRARDLAQALFGLVPPEVLNAGNVDRLAGQLRDKAGLATAPVGRLTQHIEEKLRSFGLTPDAAARVTTLRSARALLADLDAAPTSAELIQALARADIRTSEGAMTAGLARATALDGFLQSFDWEVIDSTVRLTDHRNSAATAIRARIVDALSSDEHVTPLEATLKGERAKALRLLADSGTTTQPRPSPPQPPKDPDLSEPGTDSEVLDEGQISDAVGEEALRAVEDLKSRLATDPDAHLSLRWRLVREQRS